MSDSFAASALQSDLDLVLWLHAEAAWRLHAERIDRQQHVISLLNDTEHAEKENDQLRREVRRLRREVEFEALGADTFSGADAVAEGGPQCAVHPDGAQ